MLSYTWYSALVQFSPGYHCHPSFHSIYSYLEILHFDDLFLVSFNSWNCCTHNLCFESQRTLWFWNMSSIVNVGKKLTKKWRLWVLRQWLHLPEGASKSGTHLGGDQRGRQQTWQTEHCSNTLETIPLHGDSTWITLTNWTLLKQFHYIAITLG